MIVKLSKELQRYTDGRESIEVEGTTVGDSLRLLFNMFPQLLVNFTDNDSLVARQHLCFLDGQYIESSESCKLAVTNESILEFINNIPTGESSNRFFSMILGAVMIIAGVIIGVLAGWTGIGGYIATSLIYSGAIMIVGNIATLLMYPVPKGQAPKGSLDNSATYGFGGISNTTASGTPFSIIYGTHRVGGQVLNLYTEGVSPENIGGVEVTQTNLLAQIGVGEGPITNISDVYINDLPIGYYAGVESIHTNIDMVRLGEESQNIMPYFSQVRSTNTVGLKVTNLVNP